MTDLVERLRFDSARCEATFSKGVASNIDEAIAEIERLRAALDWKDKMIQAAVQELHEGDAGYVVRTKSWLAEALVGPPSRALSGEPT